MGFRSKYVCSPVSGIIYAIVFLPILVLFISLYCLGCPSHHHNNSLYSRIWSICEDLQNRSQEDDILVLVTGLLASLTTLFMKEMADTIRIRA